MKSREQTPPASAAASSSSITTLEQNEKISFAALYFYLLKSAPLIHKGNQLTEEISLTEFKLAANLLTRIKFIPNVPNIFLLENIFLTREHARLFAEKEAVLSKLEGIAPSSLLTYAEKPNASEKFATKVAHISQNVFAKKSDVDSGTVTKKNEERELAHLSLFANTKYQTEQTQAGTLSLDEITCSSARASSSSPVIKF